LAPFAIQNPQAALALGDRLWHEYCLECRQLGIAILGMVPPTPVGPVLERANAWAKPDTDARLLRTLFVTGLQRLRQEDPDRYLVQISEWVNSEQIFIQGLGLQAIEPLAANQEFSRSSFA
jgi:hypothetical protein